MSQVFNWLKMALPENLHRPYLFKDSSFRIEQEVRFVLLANPIATSDSKGVLINIDAKTIIENSRGFKLSPELPEAERACIVRLASQLLNAAPRSQAADEEPLPTFLQPFFEDPHLPPGIFPDLD